jgi:hypothetical protein
MRVGRRTLDRAGSDSAIVPTIARVVRLCTVNWRVEGHSLTRTPPPCGQRALHHPTTQSGLCQPSPPTRVQSWRPRSRGGRAAKKSPAAAALQLPNERNRPVVTGGGSSGPGRSTRIDRPLCCSDDWFTLPTGHKVLMLDWAEMEKLLFPIVVRGRDSHLVMRPTTRWSPPRARRRPLLARDRQGAGPN